MTSRLAVLALCLLFCSFSQAHSADDCRIAVLREAGDGVVLEMVPISETEPRTFGAGEIITVVLPFGVGMSGDLVRGEDAGAIEVRCAGGEIRATSYRADGGAHDLPPASVADLARYDLRVNVTSGTGSKQAFLIRAYQDIEVDEGPVIDMFGGALPMGPGDYSITTETSPSERRPSIVGRVPLVVADGFLLAEGRGPDGSVGQFVVDFGAGATVISREFLPEGAAVEELLAIEHSRAGERILPGSMTGAGGDVGGFLGVADIGGFAFGDIALDGVSARVMDSMPIFGDTEIAGILGLDVLGRAAVASLVFHSAETGLLVLSDASAAAAASPIEIPFTMAADHIFVDGRIGESPVSFLLDTGARSTIIPRVLADAAGLRPGTLPEREFRGLDGAPLPASSVLVEPLSLGPESFPPLEAYAADLPVLDRFGLDEASGLLGIDFVLGFERADVDFAQGVLRLWAGPAPPNED
jgi:hypothetical protein